ncbi:Ger(x)C family spore germination protein [Paenibacillus sp. GCM10012306]|uniref:Ger(x)C family spore germination protein n=1 Tax=Paenibacillus sp. GCM10012306 TaxID=3317342 RepID=UPI00361CA4B1
MKRITGGILAAVMILVLLTGCWSRRELNELGIVSGIAIDKSNDQYQLTVQVVIPDQVNGRTGKQNTPVAVYKTVAPTLFEAFRKLTETSPRKIYTAHIRTLVLSEEVARDGIAKVIDILVRNPETRPDYYVLIARDASAENILKVLTPLEKIPAEALFYSLDTSNKVWAPVAAVTVDTLIDQLMTTGMSPVLPGISLLENDSRDTKSEDMRLIDHPVKLGYSGMAVFRNDKLIGWMTKDEGKGYNYIRNTVSSTAGHLKCPDGKYISLEIIRSHTEMKSRLEAGKPVIEISAKVESNIGELECSLNINDPMVLEQLQVAGEQDLEDLMRQSVEAVQRRYKVDVFGFGQVIYNAYPKLWKKLESQWDDEFPHLKVVYKVDAHIRNTGMIANSIERRMKEK